MNSPYARLFNKQILLYREEGYFNDLWNVKGLALGDRKCGSESVGNDKSLSFQTLIGIFYFLFLGLLIGTGFLLLEIIIAATRDPAPKTWGSKLRRRLSLAFYPTHWYPKDRGEGTPIKNGSNGCYDEKDASNQIINCYM